MTTVLSERDGIRYTILGETDFDQVAQVVALVFTDGSEPVTRELRVGSRDFVHFVRSLCPKFNRERLSVVAQNIATGEIVGAQLNDDMGSEISNPALVYESLAPALALLDELDRLYFRDHVVEPNHYAHFFFTAVLPQYRERRISSQLLELSLSIAASNHYKKAVAEATGLLSQHILRKAGFEPRVEIPYGTFEYNGYRPFQHIKDHPSALLMDKALRLNRQLGGKWARA